jgi:hypothetical protein
MARKHFIRIAAGKQLVQKFFLDRKDGLLDDLKKALGADSECRTRRAPRW